MDAHRLLDGLDGAQRRAVTEPTQPLAILAGAGSGKTRVLTRRIAYRCRTGEADARHVLAVTFTRKAAAELDSRLRGLGLRDLPAAGTFHALAYAQLRTVWASSGQAAPVLLDRKGRLLGRVLGTSRRVSPGDVAVEIEWAKARLVSPDDYPLAVAQADRRPPAPAEQVADWYRRYEQEKKRRGVIDFDDLLARAAHLIETDPTFAAAQRWRFRHLFVDEYQDVNPLQERLLRAWLGDRRDLCVVGDPNQAIYGWNGADADHLRRFTHHHPGAAVVELRDSYRSTPQVLAVASAVLDLQRTGHRPPVAHRPDGPRPVVVGYQSDLDEANGIARAIRDEHRPGRPWSAQAVLVRTNAQATVIETALRRASIPYRLRGAQRFLDDPEVRDLLGRFDRMREPLTTTLEDLTTSVARQRSELLLELHGDDPDLDRAAAVLPDNAMGRRVVAFEQIIRLGHELLVVDPHATTESFPGWLRTVLLDDDPGGADAVTVASFHAAKGLEWDVVHLAGIEAGYVPISHARTPETRAEEIRLLYVAVTRAAEVLRCSWAARRTFGSTEVDRKPSPFLDAVRSTVQTLARTEAPDPTPVSALDRSRAALRAAGPTDRTGAVDPARVVGRDHRRTNAVDAALRRWRTEAARQAGTRPTVVLSDRALHAIARALPDDAAALAELPGLGPLTRERHGARLLAIVADHGGDDPSRPDRSASTST